MEIAFWAAGKDGSSWYRSDMPAEALRWRGHSVWADTILPATVALRADVIVGSRVATPDAVRRWEALERDGKRLVLDLDDDYFKIHPSNAKAHAFWNRPEIREGLIRSCWLADRITVVSEGLAQSMAERFPTKDIRVVGNALPAQLLQTPRDYAGRETEDTTGPGRRVTIGWAGSQSTATALPMIARPLNMALNLRTTAGRLAADVKLVGIEPQNAHAAGLRPEVKTSGWIDANPRHYLSLVNQFDIWVAPYEDTPFNQAKFPTKALEAGFLGIPLIASDIAPYRRWIDHGVTGFLVKSPHEWSRRIKELVESAELRQRMGTAARAAASAHILQDAGENWERVLSWMEA